MAARKTLLDRPRASSTITRHKDDAIAMLEDALPERLPNGSTATRRILRWRFFRSAATEAKCAGNVGKDRQLIFAHRARQRRDAGRRAIQGRATLPSVVW
jgi:hypothetical protein